MAKLRESFGIHLRQVRKLRGWTQSRLAEAADLSLDMIGRLERGQASPSLETIEVLASVLSTSPAALFGGGAVSGRTGARGRTLADIDRHLADANEAQLRLIDRLIRAALDKRR